MSAPPDIRISFPASMGFHVKRVIEGEYDLPYHPVKPPVVLDVGANIGAFSIWALRRWPGCHVHCYEPIPDNFDLLTKNLAYAGDAVELENVAISSVVRSQMYLGKNNCGEASFFKGPEQSDETVRVVPIPPSSLPPAQVLKLDVEGAESDILGAMRVIDFDAIMIEYHSEENRRIVDRILSDYVLVAGHIDCAHRGVLKYLRKRLVRDL